MGNITQRIAGLYDRSTDESFLHLHFLAEGRRQCFSYRDVIREGWAWKLAFTERGLMPGDRVIIILPHGLEMYASFCGALLGGMVPAFFAFPSSKLSKKDYFSSVNQLISSVDGKLIVTYDALKADLNAQADAGFDGMILSYSELQAGAESVTELVDEREFYQAEPNDVAFLQFSSGTTGLKKGVAISHQALLTQVDAYANAIQLDQSDVVVSWLPLYHDMGLITCYFLPLLTGVKLVAMSPFDWVKQPLSLLELISQYRGTLCWLPNFTYNLLATVAEGKNCQGIDLSSMRGFINCSEPVLDSSHQQFLAQFQSLGLKKSALATCYAMAENTFAMTQSVMGGHGAVQNLATECVKVDGVKVDIVDREVLASEKRALPVNASRVAQDYDTEKVRCNVSCGSPVAGTEIFIINEAMEALSERSVGQIAIRSPCLFDRYFKNPNATAEAFYGELFLTGDTGYLADGELYVIGRSKDTIIINGKNIYPQDIENLLNGIAGVIAGRNVALGVFNELTGSDQLVLIIESNLSATKALAALRGEAYTVVNSHFEIQVADICVVEYQWLKKSTSGKISRKINRQRYLNELRNNTSLMNGVNDGSGKEGSVLEILNLDATPSKNAADSLTNKVRVCVYEVVSKNSAYPVENLKDDQSLVNSGIIDSLSLASLLASLESNLGVNLPERFAEDVNDIDSIVLMVNKLEALNLEVATVVSSEAGANDSSSKVSQWYSKISKSLLEDDQDIKYKLLPQLKVSDHLPTLPHAQLGRVCVSDFKSDSLNTDENGCRICTDGQQIVSLGKFKNRSGRKALVMGSSTAFGIGVSQDEYTFTNQLNRISEGLLKTHNDRSAGDVFKAVDNVSDDAKGEKISFYNCSLRSSLVNEELKAAELFFEGDGINYLIWFSGLNNLSFPLTNLAQKLAEIAVAEGHSGVAYKKSSWDALYQQNIIAPIKAEFEKLKDSPIKIIFCLQPVLTWIDKAQTAQEQELMHVFDSCFDLPLRQVISVSFAPLYQCYRADLARLCDANNIQFIDFNNDPYFASKNWLFADRVHLTDLAHEHIAQVIYPNLAA